MPDLPAERPDPPAERLDFKEFLLAGPTFDELDIVRSTEPPREERSL